MKYGCSVEDGGSETSNAKKMRFQGDFIVIWWEFMGIYLG
jgi:hypothetical protein